jgi:CheY-like chemotaxis protein/endogenous inhibitor of DNA gyrase (YacG/DUF329 family)
MLDHPAPRDVDVPSIVVLVEDDADTLDMYAEYFELSGLWVAKSRTPSDGLAKVLELRPDLVVTDLGFAGEDGAPLVEAIKGRPETQDVPVIVLTGQSSEHVPASVLASADLCLVKPVLPDALLMDVQRLIALSHTLRDRCRRASSPVEKAQVEGRAHVPPVRPRLPDVRDRPCPQCGRPLEWIERGRIGGAEYDYYRWCSQGCGLQCYDRTAGKWVKLV